MPRAGELNRRIRVERLKAEAVTDAAGRIDESDAANWETHVECWASYLPTGSREFFAADQVQADLSGQLKVRSFPATRAITSKMRVRMDGRLLNIAGPPFDPDGRNAELRINVSEPH